MIGITFHAIAVRNAIYVLAPEINEFERINTKFHEKNVKLTLI